MPGRRTGDDGLNDQQRMFAVEYLVDLNATQAAIRAGYSERTAKVQASRLLSHANVAAAISKAQDKRSRKTEITAERVLEEIAAVAFAHMGQYATWGGERVSLTDSAEVDPRAVSEVTQRVSRYGNHVSVKLHDKLGALAKLGDHLGMWKKEPEPTGGGLDVVITDERRAPAVGHEPPTGRVPDDH